MSTRPYKDFAYPYYQRIWSILGGSYMYPLGLKDKIEAKSLPSTCSIA